MIKIVFQVVLVLAVAGLVYVYFGLVLPMPLAALVAILAASVALFGMMTKTGLEFKSWLFGGPVLAAWPAGALIMQWGSGAIGLPASAAVAQAGAIFAAGVAGQIAYTVSEKRDRARDIATLSLSMIALYGIGHAIISGERLALALACFGVAVAALIARQQMILPPKQEAALVLAAAVAGMAATLHLLFSFIG